MDIRHLEIPESQEPPVAYLDIEEHGNLGYKTVPLYLDSRMRYGRASRTSRPYEVAFSRDHLEFYVIQFDWESAPLCYVRDRQSCNGVRVNGRRIDRDKRISQGFMLMDGDIITVPGFPLDDTQGKQKDAEVRSCSEFTWETAEDIFTDAPWTFTDRFALTTRTIGDGAHAKVYLALDKRTGKSRQVVCRVMDVGMLRKNQDARKVLKRWEQEIDMLRQLHHPNVIAYVHSFQSLHTIYCFNELAAGGDLFSYLSYLDAYGSSPLESDMKMIMWQVVNGLHYLHQSGVVHRDLKPENILFAVCPSPDYRIVLSDFGHSGLASQRLTSKVGTEQYLAPEMRSGSTGHNQGADMWALGLTMMAIIDMEDKLTGRSKIGTATQDETNNTIDRFCSNSPMNPGTSAQDFLKRCLVHEPRARLATTSAKRHEWFNEPVDKQRLDQLKQCIRGSWSAQRKVFPVIEGLPDLKARRRQDAPSRDPRSSQPGKNFIPTPEPVDRVSQYWTDTNLEVEIDQAPLTPSPDLSMRPVPEIKITDHGTGESRPVLKVPRFGDRGATGGGSGWSAVMTGRSYTPPKGHAGMDKYGATLKARHEPSSVGHPMKKMRLQY